jgi:hypothetical protein
VSLYIATLAEVKADLGISDTADDAVLTRTLEGLQGRFEARCNRLFARAENVTEYFDGGTRALYVQRYPIESVASVIIDSDRVFGSEDALVEDDDYVLNQEQGTIIWSGVHGWPSYVVARAIQVVYTGGYVAAGTTPSAGQFPMPEGLRGAFLLQAGFEWRNRLNLGKQSVGAQGANVSLAPAKLLPEVESVLAPFVRM